MKRFTLFALVAVLSLAVAAPALGQSGRPATAMAHVAKKKCKKKRGKKKCHRKQLVVPPTPTPAPTPPPTPNPLTDAEVINQIVARAAVYCADDPQCVDYGYYYDPAPDVAACTSKSAYSWSCLGWNDEQTDADPQPDFTCDFLEVVDRVGINGLTSHQDLSYGPNSGFACFPFVP